MESESSDIQVHVECGQLVLNLKVGERQQRLSDDLCNLCAELSASSCPDTPCMVFVKPFGPQLQWSSAGDLDVRIVETLTLPEWPLRIFKPVMVKSNEPVLFGCHLFGIDRLVNPSLAGFDLCEELMELLEAQYLSLQTTNSQLMISMSASLKYTLNTHPQSSQFVPTGIWKFYLHCSPDPHAETMWQLNHELLQPLLTNEMLTNILELTFEDSNFPLTHGLLNIVRHALYAFVSTSTANRIAVYKCMSHMGLMSNVSKYFQKFSVFLNTVMQLETSLYAYVISFDNSGGRFVLPESACSGVKSLLLEHSPFGHLAILDVARYLDDLGVSSSSFQIKNAFSEFAIQMIPDQHNSQIDRYLKAVLIVDCDIIVPGNPLIRSPLRVNDGDRHDLGMTSTTDVIAIANASIYFSQTNNFSVAISGYATVRMFLEENSLFSLQLELIVTCELMKCLNALGQEDDAVMTMISALKRVKCDPFLHHLIHLRPELKLDLPDFRIPSIDTASRTVDRAKMCLSCKSSTRFALGCSDCSKISCADCRTGGHVVHKTGDISSQDAAEIEAYSSTTWKSKAGLTGTAKRNLTQNVSEMMRRNFDTFVNLRIMLADAYIGQSSYCQAELTLEALLDIEYVAQSGYGCFAALRLSKVIRRQNAMSSKIATYNKAIRIILETLSKVAAGNESFCFDEMESIFLERSKSCDESPEALFGNASLETVRTQLQQLLSSDGDGKVFDPNPVRVQVQMPQIDTTVRPVPTSAELYSAKHQEVSASVKKTTQKGRELLPLDPASNHERPASLRHRASLDVSKHGVASSVPVAAPDKSVITNPLLVRSTAPSRADESYGALQSAARLGEVNTVRRLLDEGWNIEATGIHGTPLHRAVVGEHTETVRLLIERGANVNARTDDGTTPLHIATISGCDDIVQLLLACDSIRINMRDSSGDTPLFGAVVGKHERIVQLLLENGATANVKNIYNETPLQRAKAEGYKRIAELLRLDYGHVQVRVDDAEGRTAPEALRTYRKAFQVPGGKDSKLGRVRNTDQEISERNYLGLRRR